MLDINKIRENKQEIKKALLKRMKEKDLDLDGVLKLDDQRKELIQKVEELKAERNKFSKTKPDEKTIKKMKKVGESIKKLDNKLKKLENNLQEKLSEIPNIPADDVVAGGKENNKVIKTFKEKPKFGFKIKDHVELATNLKLIDYKRAAKMSGAGFWCYTGDGALLEWALLNYFIEFHRNNGYEFIIPPYLLNEKSAYTSGHLPKFKDDLFWCEKDGLCLNATSEMMMGNYHRDEILNAKELPKKYFSYSACFRREAGSYRKEERGMIRGHQFNKIEMFIFCKPEDSWNFFEELKQNAEKLVEGLGLHYQSSLLAAGDASAAMAKTIDVECWIPSMEIYKEVSSISNALDYQSRRGNIRFKNKDGKNEFIHMLNASGLATSRLIPAILEQFQQEDGSVKVPEVLQKFVGKKIYAQKT
ncbi:serine--tRNA ligase [Patescibacteria group bacterium]|nr:serine--tRNA ligase [Patescibacteria group bacterium]